MSRARDRVVQLIHDAQKHGATEIHFKVPQKPLFRIDRVLLPGKHPRLAPQDIKDFAYALCAMAGREATLSHITDEQFSFGLPKLGRFNICVYRQRGSLAIAIYCVPMEMPRLKHLGFDARTENCLGKSGLMLVAGGVSRARLLAALVNHYNETRRGHVVLLEDPITVLHRDIKAIIAHREVGIDVDSFPKGIRAAVHQGVDLLFVNEVENRETAESVLWAAEHGVPTIAAVAAPCAADAPWWIIRNFNGDHRRDAELRVKRLLHSIVALPDSGQPELVLHRPATTTQGAQPTGPALDPVG